jgi:hypothetical protein
MVELHLKRKVFTPNFNTNTNTADVELHLKRKVVKPNEKN